MTANSYLCSGAAASVRSFCLMNFFYLARICCMKAREQYLNLGTLISAKAVRSISSTVALRMASPRLCYLPLSCIYSWRSSEVLNLFSMLVLLNCCMGL